MGQLVVFQVKQMNYTLCYKIIWLVINLVLIFTSEDCLIVTALELLCREHYQT